MTPETKRYSDFIKRNHIVVGRDSFVYNKNNVPVEVPLSKDDDGKWYADQDDKCYSKKAAIYWYIKNKLEVVNGIIINN